MKWACVCTVFFPSSLNRSIHWNSLKSFRHSQIVFFNISMYVENSDHALRCPTSDWIKLNFLFTSEWRKKKIQSKPFQTECIMKWTKEESVYLCIIFLLEVMLVQSQSYIFDKIILAAFRHSFPYFIFVSCWKFTHV